MKTAIIFTGFVRTFAKYGHQLHTKLFDCFPNFDIYYCAWDSIDAQNDSKVSLEMFNNNLCKGIKLLNWNIHETIIPKTLPIDRPQDIYKVNKFAMQEGLVSSNRIRSQWYLVKQSLDLIPSRYYDVVVRTRFDLNYVNVSIPTIDKGITIPYNFFTYHHQPNSDVRPGFCDHVAYGDYESMKLYLSLYDHFDKMYIEENANISAAEPLLKYYLSTHTNSKINFNEHIQYQIFKNENSLDSTPLQKYDININPHIKEIQ